MKTTAQEYADKHGITKTEAESHLRRLVEAGELQRDRSAGKAWIYETVVPINMNNPFNLGASYAKRRGYIGPNMQYKYQRTDS